MLRSTSKVSLPIPHSDPQPLADSDGIYGYRMERLHEIDIENPTQYYEAVKDALRKVHTAGFALGDLHPGNVMLNGMGELVFIDLAYAGKLGEPITPSVPTEAYDLSVFHTEPDCRRLLQFFLGAHSGHGLE